MRGSICCVLALVAGLALPIFGQRATSTPRSPKRPQVPFTAEYKIIIVKTLANGTTITLESTQMRVADSQGRTLVSNTDFVASRERKRTTYVGVSDPVAGTHTSWNSPGVRATVTMLDPPHQTGQSDCFIFYATATDSTMAAPTDTGAAEPARGVVGKLAGITMTSSSRPAAMSAKQEKSSFNTVVEDLGTATIQGVEARGKRITRTTPAGAVGNDQPLVNTEETWTATGDMPDDPVVRRVSDDPQFGKQTTDLVNLSLSEPDPTTFQSPEGYEIVTQEMHRAPCPNALKPPTQ